MTRLGLIRIELRRDVIRVVGLSLAVAFGVAAAALMLVLQSDAKRLLAMWAPAGDRALTVEPPRLALGGLGARLDDAAVARLRALPWVERAIPRMLLRVPALSVYRGAFFGQQLDLTVEIAAEGVEEGAMTAALFPGERFDWRENQPLPVCISQGLIEIYNSTFAPARGLPQLDARLLRGFELPVTIGASMVGTRLANPQLLPARVVCVSPDAMLAGLTIPLAAARALNRRHGAEAEVYSSVTLIAHATAELPFLEKAVIEAGFRVGDAQATARRLGRAIRLGALIPLVAIGLLLMLAAALVATAFHGTLRARAGELRLLSALGATRSFLTSQAVAEAACVGLLGSLLGLAVAALLGSVVDTAARSAGVALPIPLGRLSWLPASISAAAGLAAAVSGAAVAVLRTRRTGS